MTEVLVGKQANAQANAQVDAQVDAQATDLELCAREPIRIPGAIQPHGFLVTFDPVSLVIERASANVATYGFGPAAAAPLGRTLAETFGEALVQAVRTGLERTIDDNPLHLGIFARGETREAVIAGASADAIAEHAANGGASHFSFALHRRADVLILEGEPAFRVAGPGASVYPLVRAFVTRLERARTVIELCEAAATEVRAICGFGRVLVYRFDEDGHGHVLAEDREAGYPSYLGQRFPASDVPAQARELYLASRIRLIANSNYEPVPILSASGAADAPLDLSFAALRSVSPVHLEYMRNMGTGASMSISIVVDGKLWGLISCHHREPMIATLDTRLACEHVGQILALQIESKELGDDTDHRLALRGTLVSLISTMADCDDFVAGLVSVPREFLGFMSGNGVAIVIDGRLAAVGETPNQRFIHALVDWMATHSNRDVFYTECLSDLMPEAMEFRHVASGVLAVQISKLHRNFVIWFRPEVVRVIEWAGDPRGKVATSAQDGLRLSPRRSFETWCQTVRGRSVRWRSSEIGMAAEFRHAALGIVLKRAEEMASLAAELGRANKELEAFSYSVSHDLRAPLRHIVGYGDLLAEYESEYLSDRGKRFLKNIVDSARLAGTLVDDLLTFSQMGRAALRPARLEMDELVRTVIDESRAQTQSRKIEWTVGKLPSVVGDAAFLLLALRNLVSNAVKYTQPRETARISIAAQEQADEWVFSISDNGVGFDMKYAPKLFGVFQRLHRFEEFEGTGIGLANVRRIVERHGGRTWADGKLDEGATFHFSLPKRFQSVDEAEPVAGIGAGPAQ
ncbi:ATP-binding protein [Chitinasiproducens palmae]|uniref:histidine kinase n=1 Tax=Chitinasiproducens palmae TaxID=1770053 RepID=A0A1H2PX92_9BURK|nr:ATP-binding protein [Chitinasiproducens palmae]SDV51593.1 Bacteriophytochrome (light-regulated signal transduction histidine kinase) [Chitinasiproducens palmae]